MFTDVSEECAASILGLIGNYKINLFHYFMRLPQCSSMNFGTLGYKN
jgi:hypothetical protein